MNSDEELKHLRAQRDELQRRMSELVTENRALRSECSNRRTVVRTMSDGTYADHRGDVMEFMGAIGQEIRTAPSVPSDAVVRLRLALIAEEFFEMLDATLVPMGSLAGGYLSGDFVEDARKGVMMAIAQAPIAVDLPALADAFCDIDYTVEGGRLDFGINGEPIDAAGKQKKPPGWKPPDIVGELRKQGWRGGEQ